jgi:putative Mg2+ transporter-C (MgtC) family protein
MLAVELLTRVGLATVLGLAIGFERQWRSRMAGLQTMALVSMGSALFLILSAYSFDQSGDRLRVAAQIVTGIGFLGAGVIMKQGMSVTGLNTAATLWATAAVGALAGAWMWREATAGAAIILAANWFLQPLASRMDRVHKESGRDATPADYVLEVVCGRQVEAEIKALVAQAMPRPAFQLRAVRTRPAHAAEQVELQTEFETAARHDHVVEDAVLTLSQQPGVTSVRWSIAHEQAADWSR